MHSYFHDQENNVVAKALKKKISVETKEYLVWKIEEHLERNI